MIETTVETETETMSTETIKAPTTVTGEMRVVSLYITY